MKTFIVVLASFAGSSNAFHVQNQLPIVKLSPCRHSSYYQSKMRRRIVLRETNQEIERENRKAIKIKPPPMAPKKRTNFRMQLFSTLNQPTVEIWAALAVLLSSFLVALSTLKDLSPEAYTAINDAIFTLNIIFSLDFFVRWYAAGQFKLRYLTTPLALIDIVVVIIPLFIGSIIPMLDQIGLLNEAADTFFYSLQNSAGLTNLILLRVLRLRRVLTDINTFGRFAVALGIRPNDIRPYQLQLARVLLSVFTLLSVASGLIYTAEHNVNPDIPDYFTALYFGMTTLTTVGFGDITPVTFYGRLVVSGSILAGISIIPTQAAKFVDALIEFQNDQENTTKSKAKRRTVGSSFLTTKRSNSSATDGNGPSGTNIEIPPRENTMGATTSSRRIPCGECGASPHRADAKFCWSCGTELDSNSSRV